MAVYIPKCGQTADGLCGCGARATTEVQVGYSRLVDGGQYEEFCDLCAWEYFRQEESSALNEVARVEAAVSRLEESALRGERGHDCPRCGGTSWPQEEGCNQCGPEPEPRPVPCPRCGDALGFASYCGTCREEVY